jgi:hypothetical protein
MPGEKRRSHRRPLKYPARIDVGDGSPLRDCVLSDVSESGARVIVNKPEDVPEQFILLVGTLGAAPRQCRVVWRDGTELGLEFRKAPKRNQPPLLPPRGDRSRS